MRKSILFLVLLITAFTSVEAQQPDITGIWAGYLELLDSAGQTVRLPYEIAVSEEKGKMTGYSRITFHVEGKDEVGMEQISLKWKGKELIVEDEGFVEHDFAVNPRRVRKTMNLQLTETDKVRTLEGDWTTNRTRAYRVPTKGTAVLKRNVDFKTSALFKRLDTLKVAEKLSFTKAEAQTVATVTTPTPPPAPVTVQAPPPPPAPEPELIIPAIEKASFATLPVAKNPKPSVAKIAAMSKAKKQQMDLLTRNFVKPRPVQEKPAAEVAAVTPKPAPKPTPPPAPKPAPTPVAKAPAPVEDKKAVAAVKPPPPPPAPVIAPSVAKGAAEVEKRATKTDKEVYFESDSLVLTLYDNGEVDGDTVTVLMNGNIVFSKAGLSTKANTKTVYTNHISGDSVSLVMYAETLGEIPPNTGLMIIMDGEKRYEVRFSADLKTNAAIILRRRKDE